MATVLKRIDDKLRVWLLAQPVFFVATAPRADDGHVNVSPKGMAGTFAVLGPNRVAYLDYFGSGVETIAHVQENGRIVIMCCAFSGPPKVVRLHGRGRVLRPDQDGFDDVRGAFDKERELGVRSIIVVDVDRIAEVCGYSVPLMEHVADRDLLDRAHKRRNPDYFVAYAERKNTRSIDGLPGLTAPAIVRP